MWDGLILSLQGTSVSPMSRKDSYPTVRILILLSTCALRGATQLAQFCCAASTSAWRVFNCAAESSVHFITFCCVVNNAWIFCVYGWGKKSSCDAQYSSSGILHMTLKQKSMREDSPHARFFLLYYFVLDNTDTPYRGSVTDWTELPCSTSCMAIGSGTVSGPDDKFTKINTVWSFP